MCVYSYVRVLLCVWLCVCVYLCKCSSTCVCGCVYVRERDREWVCALVLQTAATNPTLRFIQSQLCVHWGLLLSTSKRLIRHPFNLLNTPGHYTPVNTIVNLTLSEHKKYSYSLYLRICFVHHTSFFSIAVNSKDNPFIAWITRLILTFYLPFT